MAFITCCGYVLLAFLISHIYFTEAIVKRFGEETTAGPPSASESNGVYIVYLGGVTATTTNAHPDMHVDMLSQVFGSVQAARESIVYSYTNTFNGFAATFSESHAQAFREMETVAFVFPSQVKKVHTTASWEYLGLSFTEGLWPQAEFGTDVIIGMIDTGVWPESESFRDDGFDPIPSKWNGTCVTAEQFGPQNCNKKLIGGRFFYRGYETQVAPIQSPEYKSPRDANGHGSHTTSTAAGRQVPNASFNGVANGTASGGGSSARVAMYKACYNDQCVDADILAAFDAAITDGVDLISISIGGGTTNYLDAIALGSFHAVDQGIVVSSSAGNDGPGFPGFGTVTNVAPWIFTVGASTIDRTFVATVQLGNGKSYEGLAINTFTMNSSYPLVYGGDIPSNLSISSFNFTSEYCDFGTLDPIKAKGKIIVCYLDLYGSPDLGVQDVDGAGIIMIGQPSIFTYNIPATIVNNDQAEAILTYINSTRSGIIEIDLVRGSKLSPIILAFMASTPLMFACLAGFEYSDPRALIERSKTTFNSSAPILMATFSSTGPNTITLDISKPDITAPGVDILAAWSPKASPAGDFEDNRTVNFNILSGTSMACPHVAGAAALIKSVHPDWSPAAIKSALMTTATPLKPSLDLDLGIDINSGTAQGSGQINPTKAADPGLVYNTSTSDYILFLCSVGFSSLEVQLISGKIQACPTVPPTVLDLNYPSIFIIFVFNSNISVARTVKRTLTNVGPAAQYSVSVVQPTGVGDVPTDGVKVSVTPTTLSFTALNEEQSFTVAVEVANPELFYDFAFGSITWSDGTHSVRMPIGVGPD